MSGYGSSKCCISSKVFLGKTQLFDELYSIELILYIMVRKSNHIRKKVGKNLFPAICEIFAMILSNKLVFLVHCKHVVVNHVLHFIQCIDQ